MTTTVRGASAEQVKQDAEGLYTMWVLMPHELAGRVISKNALNMYEKRHLLEFV